MFWSTDTLKERLPELISDFDEKRIDRANYKLCVGPEIYVSPSEKPKTATAHTKIALSQGQGFHIPPGQFAFLITEEIISVPADALAFISIRAKYKFRGLVNVSGFHVDPEFKGRLVFSVFNAGPSPISLARGEPCFHIWFADLDKSCNQGSRPGYEHIESELIQPIGTQLLSFDSLSSRVDQLDRQQTRNSILSAVVIGVFGSATLGQCATPQNQKQSQPPIVIQQPVLIEPTSDARTKTDELAPNTPELSETESTNP
ncbi:dCTP deaminase domain-containing protein [Hyphomonas atlantica]|uniref:dCTP deaminase domain-containing protein n=1 Tax=Hyphomonas atlantica TaxID=1280948 RepID=UPI0023F0F95F|nr:hypothetical protein [Hyphomonas atlantica]